jgi:hypothetical protein
MFDWQFLSFHKLPELMMNKTLFLININNKLLKEMMILPMSQQHGRSSQSNEILIPHAAAAIEQMKYEIAREFGVELGPDTSSRANGSVGGEITKRLVLMAQEKLQSAFRPTIH